MGAVIYEPKGAALEYSPLACNLWTTCSHGCKYCYAPGALQKKRDEFFIEAPPRKDILAKLEQDCNKMRGDPRPILLCFVCDAYQPHDYGPALTRQALEILAHYNMTAQVLTKGGLRATRDFDILRRNKWKFGTTVLLTDPRDRAKWEPGAATLLDRTKAICLAHETGIYTWVSVEPVIDPEQALKLIELLSKMKVVDFWKIGKLNHSKEQELKIDWAKFLRDVRLLLKDKPHYIKTDLLAWDQ
jgi:DNA repair photolyase